jgi:predicted dienelactone hydrolase
MNRIFAVPVAAALMFAAVCGAPSRAGAEDVQAQAGQGRPAPVYGEWRDGVRNRVVPYKLYLPASSAPAPVVIFSHGLGGSRDGAGYLLDYLAANGFAVVAIQHAGSDQSVVRGMFPLLSVRRSISDPANAIGRFGDVRFTIDQLERENRAGPNAGRFDLSHLGLSGHSYGALTTLVAVGERVEGPDPHRFQDSRIDAAIVYSPNAPRNQEPAAALADVHTPILHMTGTKDRTAFDLEPTPEGRQIPFRTITGADQYLIVLDNGNHRIFSGSVQASDRMTPEQQAHTDIILRESLLFWRAYLMGDGSAMTALCALPERVDAAATGEVKARRCSRANSDSE